MHRFRTSLALAVVATFLVMPSVTVASDLNDGISKYTDDSIEKLDELGSPDKNINFIKMDAKSKANVRARKGLNTANDTDSIAGSSSGSGVGALNSVIVGAGGTIKGDIIIIDESKGDKYQIVD